MPFIEWKPEYSVCQPALDHEHKMLVKVINQLHDAIQIGRPREIITSTLSSLRRYVEAHFVREELVMKGCGFPHLEEHMEGHRSLEQAVADMESLYDRSPDEVDPQALLEFLRGWILNHILKEDMLFMPWIVAQQAERVAEVA